MENKSDVIKNENSATAPEASPVIARLCLPSFVWYRLT